MTLQLGPAVRRRERGSTLVEYAIVLILFLMVMFGIIDFSRALYAYHFVSNAAREATRWASVNGHNCSLDSSCDGTNNMNNGPVRATPTNVSTYVTNMAPSGIDTSKITTTPTWPGGTGYPTVCATAATSDSPGCPVQVQVQYQFSFLTPLVFNQTMTLSSRSKFIVVH